MRWVMVLCAALALLGGGALVLQQAARADLRTCLVDDTLEPVAALVEQNQKIVEGLKAGGFAASEAAVLASYMADIRKDGVPRHSEMKQRIDTLVNNNTVIVALLARYERHVKTPAFRAAAVQYRDYAISFRDRWQSLFEVFMAGGNGPSSGPVAPAGFLALLKAEAAQAGR